MIHTSIKTLKKHYDLILIGSGFASTFFLYQILKQARESARILVIERGEEKPESTFINLNKKKPWVFSLGLGGGSQCWWASTPRLHENDFKMQSMYGIGRDWPVSYETLEPYYAEVEEIMQVSGEENQKLFKRSTRYPQPPHRGTEPDALIRKDYPELFVQQPTARARIATQKRAMCCTTGICDTCPINAKFMIAQEMKETLFNKKVDLLMGYEALSLTTTNTSTAHSNTTSVAKSVIVKKNTEIHEIKGELFAIGANALFNAAILQRSDLSNTLAGKGLVEQVSKTFHIDLNGVKNFSGSTSITGHGYMFYDTPERNKRAGCLLETCNIPRLRATDGRWRERLELRFIFEDIPQDKNSIAISTEDKNGKPTVHYQGMSEYCKKGIAYIDKNIESLFPSLPIEKIVARKLNLTESHILCTTPMGDDKSHSVVDKNLVHHSCKNLFVLGGSVFPTCPPGNPTLTLSALSLYAGDRSQILQ